MKLNPFARKAIQAPVHPGVRIELPEARLSAANTAELRSHYEPMMAGECCAVLKLNSLRFMDSAGLGFLVSLRNALGSPKLLVLEGISDPTLIDLLKLTRMDQVFLISENQLQTQALLQTHLPKS